MPSLFLFTAAFADTIVLKTGKEIKGLVVEEHDDRIILSTENGEIPILRRGIKNIDYDDSSQNFMQLGKSYEEKNRMGEALAYYEKAIEINPKLDEAKKAAVRVRNLFWAKAATGPVDVVERQQQLYESWSSGKKSEKKTTPQTMGAARWLEQSVGIKFYKKGDWVRVKEVLPKRDAAAAGLRAEDKIVAVDGTSVRYLGAETVMQKIISPRYTSMTLEYDRDRAVAKTGLEADLKDYGLQLVLGTEGTEIASVASGSASDKAGLKKGDRLVEVNGESIRYVPIKKIMKVIQKNTADTKAIFTIRRSTLLTRR